MSKSAPAPGYDRFEYVVGLEGFEWQGMRTEGSPARGPVNRPRLIINGRIQGGEIVERAGLTKFNGSVFHDAAACVRHIDDFPVGPKKLWIRGDGCPDIDASTGFHLANMDQEQNPEYQRSVYYNGATSNAVMARFDGRIYIGVDSDLRRLTLVQPDSGTEMLTSGGSSQDTIVANFSGFTIRCLQAFDGKLFIGLDNGAGASKIATYDGVSVRDDLTSINVPTCFGLYRVQGGGDSIVVGFGAATNAIRYRPTGDSPGTWTSVAPGAGTLGALEMASYKDVLYIADGSGEVWSYDGSTLAVAQTVGSATAVRSVTVFNGLLYYGYETASAAIIGTFNGSVWTDVHKNLTTQFTGTSSIRSLKAYRNSLYAAGIRSSSGRLFFSPETSTSGSWTQVVPGAVTTGDLDELMVA